MPDLDEALESAYNQLAEKETPAADTPAPVEAVSAEPEAPETSEATESAEAKPEETAEEKADRARDEKGKFLPKAKAEKAEKSATPAPKPGAATQTPAPTPGASTPTRAPQSWRPAERELWSKVPQEVQSVIARRESEMARALQEAAPIRESHQKWQSVTAPFEAMIQSQGGDMHATVGNLLATQYALMTAPPAHKAALAANIISTFGIDPGLIAAHLQGQAPQATQGAGFDPARFRQELLQDFTKLQQQQQTQSLVSHYEKQWQDFSSQHEFAEDLKESIGKLIEAGLAEEFEDAYAKAASMHPEVSAALAQRKQAEQANAARASTQRSRAAASSLKSSPTGLYKKPQSMDLDSVLEAAYEQVSGTRR